MLNENEVTLTDDWILRFVGKGSCLNKTSKKKLSLYSLSQKEFSWPD